MTRGQIAIVTPEGKIITSTEFNGDMYFEGHGQDVFDNLECVETVEDYKEFVAKFNEENFRYNRQLFYECDDSFFDMKSDYFGKWFSDYIYIKNLSDNATVFTDSEGRRICVDSMERAAFYYGEYIAGSEEDFHKRILLDDLKDLRENLSYNHDDNYTKIYNRCQEYDREVGSNLCDYINQHDFVYDDALEFIVRDNADDFARLFYLMSGIERINDNIYILDGYGNLRNVDKGDFESLIDDIAYQIKQELSPPKYDFSMG